MIHDYGNVVGFELCQLSRKVQCPHCITDSVKGIRYCDCGTRLVLAEEARRLNKERCDVLPITFFTFIKGANRRARHGRSEELKAYVQAREADKQATKNKYLSIWQDFKYGENAVRSSWVDRRFLQAPGRLGCTGPLLCFHSG